MFTVSECPLTCVSTEGSTEPLSAGEASELAGVTREKEHWGREEGAPHTDPGGQAGGHQVWGRV